MLSDATKCRSVGLVKCWNQPRSVHSGGKSTSLGDEPRLVRRLIKLASTTAGMVIAA